MENNAGSDKEMTHLGELVGIYFSYTAEWDILRSFFSKNRNLIRLSILFNVWRFIPYLKPDAKRAELIELAENTGRSLAKEKNVRKGRFFKLFDSYRKILIPIMSEDFFSSMVLVYLISLQEAFIINFIKEFYLKYRQIHGPRKELKYHGKSIYGIEKYFKDKLMVSFESEFSRFAVIKEAFYRRDIVVHNRSVTDELYCKQTGYQKIGEDLKPNFEYMENVFAAMEEWNEFMLSKLIEALNLDIEISEFRSKLLNAKDILFKTL